MNRIDRYDAPEGFVAVDSVRGCGGCYFNNGEGYGKCNVPSNAPSCSFQHRKDEQDVIFIEKSEDVLEEVKNLSKNIEVFVNDRWISFGEMEIRVKEPVEIHYRVYFNNKTGELVTIQTKNFNIIENVNELQHGMIPVTDWMTYKNF